MSSTSPLMPRSVLRHRPIATGVSRASEIPEITPWIKRASRTLNRPVVAHEGLALMMKRTIARKSDSWSVTLGMSMCLTLLLILLSQSVIAWGTNCYDSLIYGMPRTYQADVAVGHEGSRGARSHFIAVNNGGQIEVIEFPGNDATHARVYMGPLLTGSQANLVPVTLAFPDPNHTGYPDMLVQVQGTTIRFLNRHGTFQPL